MKNLVLFVLSSILIVSISIYSIWMTVSTDKKNKSLFMSPRRNHNNKLLRNQEIRWIGLVSNNGETYWTFDSFPDPLDIDLIQSVFKTCPGSSFLQILSEEVEESKDAFYAVMARRFGRESYAIGESNENTFQMILQKNRVSDVHIITTSDITKSISGNIILRIVLRTDQDATKSLDHFMNIYLGSDPSLVIVDLRSNEKYKPNPGKILKLVDTILSANYKIYSMTTKLSINQLDIISDLERFYDENPHHENRFETLVFIPRNTTTRQCAKFLTNNA
jgi:hypothetical protein